MTLLLATVRRHWISITLFTLTVITTLSLYPLESLPVFPGSDKTHHFIAYGALMFPLALRKPKYWLLISVLFILWGGGIELIQPYVNRYVEWLDLAANVAGLGCGLLLAQFTIWIFPAKLESK